MKIKEIAVIAVMLIFSSGIWAGEAGSKSLNSRIDYIGKLINISSGAKQVIASGVPEALAAQEQARQIHAEAKKIGSGQLAEEKLAEATKKMFQAIKLAKSDSVTKGKKKRDYLKKKQSIQALVIALKRIGQEKDQQDKSLSTEEQVNGLIKHADKLEEKDEFAGAMVLIDQAYQHVKSTIESMRSGDTLVRSLNFDSKEDEFNYELDRNDTHMMLLKVLTKDKKISETKKQKLDGFISEARSLRQQAEAKANAQEYEEAIKFLEKSTKNVVKAIRGAGVYIPG